jgi:hypothetical protein
MVWGAIGWDWKSPLIFLVKEEGRNGICSQAYLNQVLNPIIFPWLDSLTAKQKEKFLFMEDGSKIHMGMAKLPCNLRGLRRFDWPPSSPDLNPIEKIWQWMKNEITKLETVPTSIEDMKEVL